MMHLAYARIADIVKAAGVQCAVGDPPENWTIPYAFVWGPLPTPEALTASGCDSTVDVTCHLQVVSDEPPAVLELADTLADAIHNATINISGWRVFPLKVTGSTEVATERGVLNMPTKSYPAWLTLHIHLQATKE